MTIHAKLESISGIPGAYRLIMDEMYQLALYSKGGYLLILDPAYEDEIIEWLQRHNKPIGQVEIADQ